MSTPEKYHYPSEGIYNGLCLQYRQKSMAILCFFFLFVKLLLFTCLLFDRCCSRQFFKQFNCSLCKDIPYNNRKTRFYLLAMYYIAVRNVSLVNCQENVSKYTVTTCALIVNSNNKKWKSWVIFSGV